MSSASSYRSSRIPNCTSRVGIRKPSSRPSSGLIRLFRVKRARRNSKSLGRRTKGPTWARTKLATAWDALPTLC